MQEPLQLVVAEAQLPLGPPRPENLLILGAQETPLGVTGASSTNPDGSTTAVALEVSHVRTVGIDLDAYNQLTKNQFLEQLDKHTQLLQTLTNHYTLTYNAVVSPSFLENPAIIIENNYLFSPSQLEELCTQCSAVVETARNTYDDNNAQEQERLKALITSKKQEILNHYHLLLFLLQVHVQILSEKIDEKWEPSTFDSLTPGAIIALFTLRSAIKSRITFCHILQAQGEDISLTLLQKLSKAEKLNLLKCYREWIALCLRNELLYAPLFANDLTTKEIVELTYLLDEEAIQKEVYGNPGDRNPYSCPPHLDLRAYYTLTSSLVLDKLLQDKPRLMLMLAQVNFNKLSREVILPSHEPCGTILEKIKPHMTQADWVNYMSTCHRTFSLNEGLHKFFQDFQVCDLIPEEVLCKKVRAKASITSVEYAATLFNHPGASDLYFLNQKPNFNADKDIRYFNNYVYVESTETLYFVIANGLTDNMATQDESYPCPPFNLEKFKKQLQPLKEAQGSQEKVHLTRQDVQRLIIDNHGRFYNSYFITKFTEACRRGQIADLMLKIIAEHYYEFRPTKKFDCSHHSNLFKQMERQGWDSGYCSSWLEVHPHLNLSATPSLSSTVPAEEESGEASPQPPSPEVKLAPPLSLSLPNKATLASGAILAMLGALGTVLIKLGALSGIGGPYLWPISLGLIGLGALLLIGVSTHPLLIKHLVFSTAGSEVETPRTENTSTFC